MRPCAQSVGTVTCHVLCCGQPMFKREFPSHAMPDLLPNATYDRGGLGQAYCKDQDCDIPEDEFIPWRYVQDRLTTP